MAFVDGYKSLVDVVEPFAFVSFDVSFFSLPGPFVVIIVPLGGTWVRGDGVTFGTGVGVVALVVVVVVDVVVVVLGGAVGVVFCFGLIVVVAGLAGGPGFDGGDGGDLAGVATRNK